ncbi:MAG: hypothetical protein SFU25_04495 [Candidatus Caenarcaniphilales bacterium]|nr:hypothetical protein [Candidatus Caenarcaniphilales bacterium]
MLSGLTPYKQTHSLPPNIVKRIFLLEKLWRQLKSGHDPLQVVLETKRVFSQIKANKEHYSKITFNNWQKIYLTALRTAYSKRKADYDYFYNYQQRLSILQHLIFLSPKEYMDSMNRMLDELVDKPELAKTLFDDTSQIDLYLQNCALAFLYTPGDRNMTQIQKTARRLSILLDETIKVVRQEVIQRNNLEDIDLIQEISDNQKMLWQKFGEYLKSISKSSEVKSALRDSYEKLFHQAKLPFLFSLDRFLNEMIQYVSSFSESKNTINIRSQLIKLSAGSVKSLEKLIPIKEEFSQPTEATDRQFWQSTYEQFIQTYTLAKNLSDHGFSLGSK